MDNEHLASYFLNLVPTVGLEPTQLSPPPPQDGVSTNSTMSAFFTSLHFQLATVLFDRQECYLAKQLL